MANYRASLPAVATRTESSGTVTYASGEYMGKLVSVATAPTTFDVKLYADDNVAERAKGVTEVALTINTTTVPLSMVQKLFGGTFTDATSGASATPAHAEKASTDNAPYVGFGFIYAEMVDNTTKYFCKWFPKVKFALPSETFTTQGETIAFGTPTMNATAENDSVKGFYEQTFEFTSADDAKEKLKTLLSIA